MGLEVISKKALLSRLGADELCYLKTKTWQGNVWNYRVTDFAKQRKSKSENERNERNKEYDRGNGAITAIKKQLSSRSGRTALADLPHMSG